MVADKNIKKKPCHLARDMSKNDSKDSSGNGHSDGGSSSGGSSDAYTGMGQEVMFDDKDLPF